jgi:hypothetical protein
MEGSKERLEKALGDLFSRISQSNEEELSTADEVEILKAAYERYLVKHDFKVGQIAVWKERLQNIKPDGPFLITEILQEPITIDDDKLGRSYLGAKFNAFALTLAPDGDVINCPIDLDLMQPYVPTVES